MNAPSGLPPEINPRNHQGEVPTLGGYSSLEICAALQSLVIDGHGSAELSVYASEDNERFLRTIAMLPDSTGRVLEIGSNPYFSTTLMRWFRPNLSTTATNYFGQEGRTCSQHVQVRHPSGTMDSFDQTYVELNVEGGRFPFDDGAFDFVLFCEVIEHMMHDPMAALTEIWRVLKPDGTLLLTTPNVCRLENVARSVAGSNNYDPYSGYGPYGRHNREYSRHEVVRLLRHAGFAPELEFTADVHDNRARDYYPEIERLVPLLSFRAMDLGQYLFVKATKAETASDRKPSWLYRSWPSDLVEIQEL
jgi:SAM-dependent methyltransferase